MHLCMNRGLGYWLPKIYTVVTNTENMHTVVTSAGKDIANAFGYQSSKMYIVVTRHHGNNPSSSLLLFSARLPVV